MGILKEAPRGGLVENLAGSPRVLVLRNAEIERLEDAHGSVFDIWDGFMGKRPAAKSGVVRDIVALGLVGGGMADAPADAIAQDAGPDQLPLFRTMAQALIGVAFAPDLAELGDDEDEAPPAQDDPEKKP